MSCTLVRGLGDDEGEGEGSTVCQAVFCVVGDARAWVINVAAMLLVVQGTVLELLLGRPLLLALPPLLLLLLLS